MTEQQIQKFMDKLGCTEQEARELAEYDNLVDHAKASDSLEYDLTKEQKKVAQKMTRTGTRKMKETGLRLEKRERKPDATKENIISALATFLAENEDFSVENVQIVNKQGEVSFDFGGENYSFKLTRHRKAKS